MILKFYNLDFSNLSYYKISIPNFFTKKMFKIKK
jgi:hypothetical protein